MGSILACCIHLARVQRITIDKGYFSIVLLALVDYNYKFLFVDVGCQGSISDGGVYRNSPFNDAIQKGTLNLPDPEPLPQSIDPANKYKMFTK